MSKECILSILKKSERSDSIFNVRCWVFDAYGPPPVGSTFNLLAVPTMSNFIRALTLPLAFSLIKIETFMAQFRIRSLLGFVIRNYTGKM